MDIKEFAELIAKLRIAQKNYFKTREPRYLLESKQWEREVDRITNFILNPDKQEKLSL